MSAPSEAELAFATSVNPEATFCAQLEALIRRRPAGQPDYRTRDWKRRPFRPLLLGYNGKGNVGADIRVREMIRQIRTASVSVGFEPELLVMGDFPIDPVLASLPQVRLNGYFPDLIDATLDGLDGVIACEGSMFTSKFSDLLSATFAGGLGVALRQGKFAVGYGAESGQMSASLSRFVSRTCQGALILSRSRQTHEHLSSLGLRSTIGADSAWSYAPSEFALQSARDRLLADGWDGKAPVAVVCPMNPFFWPVKVDVRKARELKEFGRHKELHYDSVLFHSDPPGAHMRFARYLETMKRAIDHLTARGYFAVIVGMDSLDRTACTELRHRCQRPLSSFVSGEMAGEFIVSVLHSSTLVITSRFHGAVLSLNAGVKTIGIAIDERIRNLFSENGLQEWFLRSDDPDLGERLIETVDKLQSHDLREAYDRLLCSQLRMLGSMCLELHGEMLRVFDGMAETPAPLSWRKFLPPLSPTIQELLSRESGAQASA